MRGQFLGAYEDIISLENLFAAWEEFVCGKRQKKDVMEFGFNLADNIVQLHEELASKSYVHGGYQSFYIIDPKPRHIHKASVRDRVLHHAICRKLYPFFDRTFITDSFSCRIDRGTHKALDRFRVLAYKASLNHTRTVWVLKMDIKKFFASMDHEILLEILNSYLNPVIASESALADERGNLHVIASSPPKADSHNDIIWLLEKVIRSFESTPGKGLPLGNLTSQLFCNVYMNEFDQFIKHKLRAKYYIRYADDFIILSESKPLLLDQTARIAKFLDENLQPSLHPDKIVIRTLASGIDFLGWVHFLHHRILRKTTKTRMLKRIRENATNETLQSYLGLLSHGNAFKLKQKILNWHGLWSGGEEM